MHCRALPRQADKNVSQQTSVVGFVDAENFEDGRLDGGLDDGNDFAVNGLIHDPRKAAIHAFKPREQRKLLGDPCVPSRHGSDSMRTSTNLEL